MFLARVTRAVVAVQKHEAYRGKTVYVVQPVDPDGTPAGAEWVAVDYVGAGVGDTVVCGGAPGVARAVFNVELAPIRTLIMAIVDSVDMHGEKGEDA
ncbi:MAG TPA: EutN/CcmL family microcompartment protein [Bacteroidota bacterium]|nr:EutN/CcmL family microcompartment protein [Bacteroidota bacterium]